MIILKTNVHRNTISKWKDRYVIMGEEKELNKIKGN